MLVRIVQMTIQPDALDTFLEYFDASSPKIRARSGCLHLELLHDVRYPNVCTTYSHWTDPDALQAYRESDLFRSTWARVKPLFAARPTATSYHVARSAETIAAAVAT